MPVIPVAGVVLLAMCVLAAWRDRPTTGALPPLEVGSIPTSGALQPPEGEPETTVNHAGSTATRTYPTEGATPSPSQLA